MRLTQFPYLMEHENEAVRLLRKDRSDQTRRQLFESGIGLLNDAPCLVDAGSGSGVVAKQMAEIATNIYSNAEIILLDASSARLTAAKENLQHLTTINKQFINCKLESIALPDNAVDYVFCRFVFEYVSNPRAVFSELARIVKPGGKLVVGDLDQNSLTHFPLSDILQKQLDELVAAVEKTGLLDFQAGRKIYSYFYDANFANIKVNLYAHHLFHGELTDNDYFNWSNKIDQLIQFQEQSVIALSYDLVEFKHEFMSFLLSPRRFSYTPLILVEGVKPNES